MTRILVTGVTGLFGGEVARQLDAKGLPFRVLVRDSSRAPRFSQSAEISVGDFADPATLTDALFGIEKLFLATYDQPEIIVHQANVLAAARQAGVQHVVRLSTDGTDKNRDLPLFAWHRECEQQLESSGLDFTHVKPGWIMQNFESFVVNDQIRLPAGDGRIGLVDARDVASVAVAALTEPGHEGISHILYTEPLSHYEVAEYLSESTGRAISFQDITPETYAQELEADRWSEDDRVVMLGLFEEIRAGSNIDAQVTDTVKTILGRDGIRFRQFAADYAASIGVTQSKEEESV